MRFLSKQECVDWCELLQIPLDSTGWPDSQKGFGDSFRVLHPREPYRIFNLAQVIESITYCQDERLLWVTNSVIWPSSVNSHLYNKLKESYGDPRPIADSPGHLFGKVESNDVITFLQLLMLFGWDAYLFSKRNCVSVFCSHDEWLEVFAHDAESLDVSRKSFLSSQFLGAAT